MRLRAFLYNWLYLQTRNHFGPSIRQILIVDCYLLTCKQVYVAVYQVYQLDFLKTNLRRVISCERFSEFHFDAIESIMRLCSCYPCLKLQQEKKELKHMQRIHSVNSNSFQQE